MNNSEKIKTMTATEFIKNAGAVYSILEILEDYEAIEVTRHGKSVIVIHRPDAPIVGIECDDDPQA